jgi:flagellar biosynthetic protein FliR
MLSAFAVVLFFLVGGHLAVIGAFTRSFDFAPAGHPAVCRAAAEQVVVGTARVIELGVRIASPFIGLNFIVTLAFASLGRTLPRVQVYLISMPARALLGIALLAGAGTLIARHLFGEFNLLPVRLLELVAAH